MKAKMVAYIYQQYQMDGSSGVMCDTTTAFVRLGFLFLRTKLHRPEISIVGIQKLLKLSAVYPSFIYLSFLDYVTAFLKFTVKCFLIGAPRRKTVLRNVSRAVGPNLRNKLYAKEVFSMDRLCKFHLTKIIRFKNK
jgi:hypothetical protein